MPTPGIVDKIYLHLDINMADKAPNNAQLKLLIDQPYGEGSKDDKDYLNFSDYAEVLADITLNENTPLTIGVFGDWGTGKTSLMRMIERKLRDKKQKNLAVVWFNAWRYEQEEHPIVPLIASIVKELERERVWPEITRPLRSAAYGVSISAGPLNFSGKDMIDREAVLKNELIDRSLYWEAFKELEEIAKGQTKAKSSWWRRTAASEAPSPRIVVLIDDLDRCQAEGAIKLLEKIKLVLAQPGFIFIVGVARKVIEECLKHRYKKDYGVDDFKSASYYLDKIIQVPFTIPSHTEQITDFSTKALEQIELKEEDVGKDVLKSLANTVAIASENNPRIVKRFVNSLVICHRIKATIPLEYFAITLCFQFRMRQEEKFTFEAFSNLLESDNNWEALASWCVAMEWREKAMGGVTSDIFKGYRSFAAGVSGPQKFGVMLPANEDDTAQPILSERMKEAEDFFNNHKDLRGLLAKEAGQNWLEQREWRKSTILYSQTQRVEPDSATEVTRIKAENTRLRQELLERMSPQHLVDLLTAGVRPPKERVEAGNVLSRLGDPRFHGEDMFFLPNDGNLGLVKIEAEGFTMGEERRWENIEYDYWIGKYPVTVAQFRAFIKTKYSGNWNEKWWRYNSIDNHPVVFVSWNEAAEYCGWLTDRLCEWGKKAPEKLPIGWKEKLESGWRIFLPTEAQWEFAAQGEKARKWPWGEPEISPEYANYDKTGIGGTSPVGCFPAGNTPEKVTDMAGNVWDWCWDSNKYYNERKSKGIVTNPPDTDQGEYRVSRGGGWDNSDKLCRPTHRYDWRDMDVRGGDNGFRLTFSKVFSQAR